MFGPQKSLRFRDCACVASHLHISIFSFICIAAKIAGSIWILPRCILNNLLKPLHTIGNVSLNASILYKNQEICNKTTLWKFQLISLFLLWENSKNAFSIFVFILMARVFVSRDENSLLDLISLIIRKRKHIRQKYFKESFLPSLSLYHVSYV